jgi:hypothetical protein
VQQAWQAAGGCECCCPHWPGFCRSGTLWYIFEARANITLCLVVSLMLLACVLSCGEGVMSDRRAMGSLGKRAVLHFLLV